MFDQVLHKLYNILLSGQQRTSRCGLRTPSTSHKVLDSFLLAQRSRISFRPKNCTMNLVSNGYTSHHIIFFDRISIYTMIARRKRVLSGVMPPFSKLFITLFSTTFFKEQKRDRLKLVNTAELKLYYW